MKNYACRKIYLRGNLKLQVTEANMKDKILILVSGFIYIFFLETACSKEYLCARHGCYKYCSAQQGCYIENQEVCYLNLCYKKCTSDTDCIKPFEKCTLFDRGLRICFTCDTNEKCPKNHICEKFQCIPLKEIIIQDGNQSEPVPADGG